MRNILPTKLTQRVLLATIICCGNLTLADDVVADTELSQKLTTLVRELGAKHHEVRAAASASLKDLSAEDVAELAKVALEQPNAEVVIRIQAEVESRYTSENEEDVEVASNALESSAGHQRLVLADQAAQALRQHWHKRIELATAELERHGAIVKHGEFTRGRMNRMFPGQQFDVDSFQILITESWSGGDEALAIFDRLAALCGPSSRIPGGISVFLIGGNPLTNAQETRLINVVGSNRVVKRSRVALGIKGTPSPDQGVMIMEVSEGSSAKDAGLKEGDLILAIDDPSQKSNDAKDEQEDSKSDEERLDDKTLLRDFDDLVARLMDYKPGDVMTMRVIRNYPSIRTLQLFGRPDLERFPRQPLKIETIKVKLKGWEHLKVK